MNSRWIAASILAVACNSAAWGQQASFRVAYSGYWMSSVYWSANIDPTIYASSNSFVGLVDHGIDATLADYGFEPPPVYASRLWTAPAGLNASQVSQSFYAGATPMFNNAELVQDGWLPTATTTPGTCPVQLNACPAASPMGQIVTSDALYGGATSTWTDYYTIGGGTGAGVLVQNYRLHAVIGASPNAVLPGDGSLTWRLLDTSGRALAGFAIYYSADGLSQPVWEDYLLNAATGNLAYFGNEPTGADPLVITRNVSVSIPFTYGTTFGLSSDLALESYGNTTTDASNTVDLTSVILPAGARLFADSGAAYDVVTRFDGAAGTVCKNLACALVPEPNRLRLVIAGLIVLGLAGRTKTRRQVVA